MSNQNERRDIIEGLQEKISWMAQSGRSPEEMAKTVEALIQTAEKFVAEDSRVAFYNALQELVSRKP